MKLGRIKIKIYRLIEKAPDNNIPSKLFDYFIILLIFVNIIAVILGSVKSLNQQYSNIFNFIETFSIVIFTMEYLLRLWTCTVNDDYKHSFWGRIKYIFSFFGIIDLLAIVPFYLPKFYKLDYTMLRILRIFRILRFMKLGRYFEVVNIILRVFRNKWEELIATLLSAFVLLILASSLMFYFENPVQPDKFSSILSSMWWGVITLTTVGYGEIYPVTTIGKIISSIISIIGIGLFALPAGLLAAGFSEEIQKKKKKIICPKCGYEIEE